MLTVAEQFGKVLRAQNITEGGLCHTVGRVVSILHLDNRVNRVFDTEVDHCVHTSCNTVFGENLGGKEGGREGGREGGSTVGSMHKNNLAFSHLLWGNVKGDSSKVNHSHIVHAGQDKEQT